MLDMHVDVFERRVLCELAASISRRDLQQPSSIALASSADKMPCLPALRHGRGWRDVLAPQSLVDAIEAFISRITAAGRRKAPAPHLIGVARAADRPLLLLATGAVDSRAAIGKRR
jgi:hypothetical protein